MLFSTVTSALAAGALKLGYKLAEQQKWLPGIFYHKAALQEMKNGNLRKAEMYNNIALQKKSKFENACIVRELIAMQKDARMAQLLKLIATEDDAIAVLQEKISHTKHDLARSIWNEKLLKIILPLFIVLVSGGLFVWIYFFAGSSRTVYFYALSWGIILIVLFILERTTMEKFRVKQSVTQQERKACIVSSEKELLTRLKKRENLFSQVDLIFL